MSLNLKYFIFTLLVGLSDRLVKFFVFYFNSFDLWLLKLQAPQLNKLFSLSLPINNHYSIALSIVGILIVILLFSSAPKTHKYLYLAIIGAAISNLYDRFIYGGVIDYLSLLNLSVINLADIVIFISAIILIYKHFKIDRI